MTLVGASTYADAILTFDEGSYITSGLDSSGSVFVNLDNVPVDFLSMDSLTVSCVVRLEGTQSDDTTQLYAQIFQSDEATALTDEAFVTDHTTGATYTTDSTAMVLNANGSSAGEAVWNGAMLRLRWVFTKQMASDGIALRVTQAYVDGIYTPGEPPPIVVGVTQVSETDSALSVSTLGTPQGLTGTAVTSTQIDLEWRTVTTATSYDIERDGSILVNGHTTNTYSDTGLTAGATYVYRVRSAR